MVGDGHGPSRSTVCRTVHKVCALIVQHFGGILAWPSRGGLAAIKEKFHALGGLPDVIGTCISLKGTVHLRNICIFITFKLDFDFN